MGKNLHDASRWTPSCSIQVTYPALAYASVTSRDRNGKYLDFAITETVPLNLNHSSSVYRYTITPSRFLLYTITLPAVNFMHLSLVNVGQNLSSTKCGDLL